MRLTPNCNPDLASRRLLGPGVIAITAQYPTAGKKKGITRDQRARGSPTHGCIVPESGYGADVASGEGENGHARSVPDSVRCDQVGAESRFAIRTGGEEFECAAFKNSVDGMPVVGHGSVILSKRGCAVLCQSAVAMAMERSKRAALK